MPCTLICPEPLPEHLPWVALRACPLRHQQSGEEQRLGAQGWGVASLPFPLPPARWGLGQGAGVTPLLVLLAPGRALGGSGRDGRRSSTEVVITTAWGFAVLIAKHACS